MITIIIKMLLTVLMPLITIPCIIGVTDFAPSLGLSGQILTKSAIGIIVFLLIYCALWDYPFWGMLRERMEVWYRWIMAQSYDEGQQTQRV